MDHGMMAGPSGAPTAMNMGGMPMGGSAAANGTAKPWCTGATVMQMGFVGSPDGQRCVLYLFQGWVLDSQVKFAFATIGTVLMGVVVEALSHARRKHVGPATARALQAVRASNGSGNKARAALWGLAYFLTYAAQITFAYFLMLLAMTYAAWMLIAIVLGLSLGHVAFHDWSKAAAGGLACSDNGDNTCCGGDNNADDGSGPMSKA